MALPNSKPRCVSSMPSLTQRRTLACVRSTSLQRTELFASARSRMRHSRPSANFGGGSPANTRASTCSTGRSNFRGSTSSLPSAARSSSRKRSARDSDPVPTASTFSFTRYSAVVRSDFSSAFGSSSSRVCSLSLRLVRRPGSSCMRSRYSARRTSSASLTAAIGSTRTWLRTRMRSAPATRRASGPMVGTRRRLEAGAALGVAAARLEHRGCEPLGQSLLGVGPRARHGIETDAAEHRRLLRKR